MGLKMKTSNKRQKKVCQTCKYLGTPECLYPHKDKHFNTCCKKHIKAKEQRTIEEDFYHPAIVSSNRGEAEE
jgi:hypothetical protein